MEHTSLFFRFGVALVIGVLVGLQREFANEKPDRELATGVRTLALMGLIGCGAAFVSDVMQSPWPFVVVVAIVGGFFLVNYFIEASRGETGLTTEASGILTILAGALAYWDQVTLAVALGVTTTVLLSVKLELHRFVAHITREDIYATLKFAVITAIVLPVLPNRVFGPVPFQILNPYKIWLLIVLISGISFVGYIFIKTVGTRKGLGITGLMGGLASSTAVTLSLTQVSKSAGELAKPLAVAITIAWTVMFSRVLVEVYVLNHELARIILLPILAPVAAGLLYGLVLFRMERTDRRADVTFHNPFELGPAITFGLIFTVVLVLSRAAQIYMGDAGIYLSSVVAGLADVDAIALSMAELSRGQHGIDMTTAARAIVLAAVANTFLKGCMVMVLGESKLRRVILPGCLLIMATGTIAALVI